MEKEPVSDISVPEKLTLGVIELTNLPDLGQDLRAVEVFPGVTEAARSETLSDRANEYARFMDLMEKFIQSAPKGVFESTQGHVTLMALVKLGSEVNRSRQILARAGGVVKDNTVNQVIKISPN